MPQNQRLASGFAIDKAEMSSSSPGRIAVPSATMSRPAGSKMKPEEARPTQVACVQLRFLGARRRNLGEQRAGSMLTEKKLSDCKK
jgi:hypothetical protein